MKTRNTRQLVTSAGVLTILVAAYIQVAMKSSSNNQSGLTPQSESGLVLSDSAIKPEFYATENASFERNSSDPRHQTTQRNWDQHDIIKAHKQTLDRYFSLRQADEKVLTDQKALLAENEFKPYADHSFELHSFNKGLNDERSEETNASATQTSNASSTEHQKVWDLIAQLEQDKRIYAYEALSLKLKWLEKNIADPKTLKTKAEALISDYHSG